MKTRTALLIGGAVVALALGYAYLQRRGAVAPPTAGGGGGWTGAVSGTVGGALSWVGGLFNKIPGAATGANTGTSIAKAPGDAIASATSGIPVVGSVTGGIAKGTDWVADHINPFNW